MRGIILAGGKGTRLHPVTLEVPKPLLTVQRKPILNYIVDLFLYHKIEDITIVIPRDECWNFDKWRKEYYLDYIKDREGEFPRIRFELESRSMGTAGWLYWYFRFKSPEDIVVSNGDEIKDINLTDMISFHRRRNALVTIGLVKVKDPKTFGVVECDRESRVLSFVEKPKKPKTKYISSGTYVINEMALDFVKSKKKFIMLEKDIFPKLTETGFVYAYKSRGRFYPIDTFERWEKAIKEI